MKKLLVILILLPLVSYSQYSNGYRDGWKKGYCYGITYGCIAPNPPIAPTPNLTKGEDFTYKSGYSRGLLDGKAANSGGGSSRSKGIDYSKQYEYAPGGAKSQQMTNDAIDRALNNRRRSSNRGNSNYNNSSGSRSNAPSKDYSLYNSGVEKFNAKDYTGAKKDFTAFIQKYPNDGDGWTLRGNTKSWLNDFSGACYDWKRGADLGNEDAQKNLLKNCNSDGTYAESNNKGLTINPKEYLDKANSEYKKGNYIEAKEAIDIALKGANDINYENKDDDDDANRAYARIFYERGLINQALGDDYAAISDFNKSLEYATKANLNIYRDNSINKLYQIKREIGDLKGATKDLDKLIELYPINVRLYNDRAATKRDNGDTDGAQLDYIRGLSIDSTYTTLWGGAGTAVFKEGEVDIACNIWRKAVKTGTNEEAKKVYQKMIDENCGDIKSDYEIMYSDFTDYSLYNSGYEKFNAKDYLGAIEDLSEYLNTFPGDSDGWNYRALSKTWLDDYEGACDDFKIAAVLGDTDADDWVKENCN